MSSMMKRSLLIALILGLAFTGLSSEKKSKFPEQPFYAHFSGKIDGKHEFRLDLLSRTSNVGGDPVQASYYYEKIGAPIELTVSVKDGKLRMTENGEGGLQNVFEADWPADGKQLVIEGRWKSAKPKKDLPFTMKEDYSRSLAFEAHPLTRSIKLSKQSNKSPEGEFRALYLAPRPPGAKETPVVASIRKILGRAFFGESFDPKKSTTLALDNLAAEFAAEYRENVLPDWKAGDDAPYFSWSQDHGASVRFNDRDLVSVEHFTYSFSGGAHGNYGSAYYVFDLTNGKELGLADLFRDGYKTKLPPILERVFVKKYGEGAKYEAGKSMEEYGLLVDRLPVPDNFFVDRRGITFVYNPYEVGPYVLGGIDLLLTWDDLKGVLKANTPLDRLK